MMIMIIFIIIIVIIHTNTKLTVPQLEPFPEASKRRTKTKSPQLSGDSPRTRRFVCGQRG